MSPPLDASSSAAGPPRDGQAAAARERRGTTSAASLLGKFGSKLAERVLNWPGGRWPVPTATSLLIVSALLVGAAELTSAWTWFSDVTLSVKARTEVTELELFSNRDYVWWLPAGSYTLLAPREADDNCTRGSAFDTHCSYAEPTAITMRHGGTVRLEALPAETATADAGVRFSITLMPRKVERGTDDASAIPPSAFEIHAADDRLLAASGELVTFESEPVDLWRVPLIVRHAQIGEFLSESVAAGDSLGAVRQPIMLDGDIRFFARSFGYRERYQIKEEAFDPADVVQIPAERAANYSLLGLVSLGADDDQSGAAFDLTLHTDVPEVAVRRLRGGHTIGVSTWWVLSKQPFWIALWAVWVSLILVSNYYSDRLGELRGHDDAQEKLRGHHGQQE